jgi:hypothetical protein
MKKILMGVLFGLTGYCHATENANIYQLSEDVPGKHAAWGGLLTNETALAYSKNYDYDLSEVGAGRISAVVNYGSATPVANTFTDGRTSSGTITIASTTSLRGTIMSVNGIYFQFGPSTDMNTSVYTPVAVGASTGATANNLLTKINANTALAALISGTSSYNVIDLVSKACDGVAYALTTTSAPLVTIGGNMGLGSAAKVSKTTDKITITAHGWTTGLPVLYEDGGVGTVGGLTTGTTYYVYKVDANTVELASTSAKAVLADVADITAVTIGTTAHTFTLTPLAISGTPSFKWRWSNNGTDFIDVNVTSVTISAYTNPYASVAYDFEEADYRYLRLAVTGPTTGGVYLNTMMYIKKQ